MTMPMLICAGLLSASIACALNWLALIPWRRTSSLHWTERARAYHPVRLGAAANLWTLPAVLSMASCLLWPETTSRWPLVAIVTSIGTLFGTIPMDREVFPQIKMPELLRQVWINWMLRFLMWFVFLGAIALMPKEFNWQVPLLVIAVFGLGILWDRTLWLSVGLKCGFVVPPSERVQKIVNETAAKMNIPVKEVWILRSSFAQAFAMPGTGRLLFTERIAELLSDAELSSVCAHELGHLSESRSDYLKRYLQWLVYLPWLLLTPMIHRFGQWGFFALLANTMLVPYICRKLSHKLEVRADQIATTQQLDAGTYARALLRLHEDNLLPAVVAKDQLTHPHLYDRLLAAGVTPDFPRPSPPSSMAWNGVIFSAGVGVLAMILLLR